MVLVREAGEQDLPFLLRMLALAAGWRPDTEPRPVASVLREPALARYAPDLSGRDTAVIISGDKSGDPAGGAWWRFLAPPYTGYGFVAEDVPELTIAVLPEHRGQGVGRAMLDELVRLARAADLKALSLSVEPDNPAVRLYAKVGFVPVGRNGGAVTMLLPLTGSAATNG